jgi:pimeloyl-ACP methyl ester carboxylesterase
MVEDPEGRDSLGFEVMVELRVPARRRLRLAVLAAVLSSVPLARPARAEAPRLPLTPCRLKGGVQASCGVLEVPEDRRSPQGRRLRLRVAVVPALARAPRPDPLFLLAGGPGQAATEAFPELLSLAFERVHRSRDVVLVDQRGTGASNPLRCRGAEADAPLARRLADRSFPAERLKACLAGYDADPRLYTTSIAMQDLDEVRAALGYGQIDLWGGSYGTRAALVYLREHESSVRAVILDGVAPPTMRISLDMAADAQRAMDLLFKACAEAPACARAWPELPARFDRLLERLEKHPPRATVADPVTGSPVELTLSRDLLTGVLRAVLYQPGLPAMLVPLLIAHTEAGDYGPLVALATTLDDGARDSMAEGLLLSVLCAEDVPRFSEAEALEHARGTFLGASVAQSFREGCAVWPRGEPPPGFAEPVRSDKPVLLLSGELDPVTPPARAEEAARTLPRSRHFVVPGVGHGASGVGCVPRLVFEFLEAGSVAGLDGACVEKQKRPPFFVNFAGPTP